MIGRNVEETRLWVERRGLRELAGQLRRVAANTPEDERSSDNLLREDLFSHLYIEEEDGSNLKHIKRMVQIDQG